MAAKSTNIKYAALNELAGYFHAQLGIRSEVVFSEDIKVEYPSLALVPRQFAFQQWQPQERNLPPNDPNHSVNESLVEVGAFEGEVELRLYANSAPMREEWTQRIVNLFLGERVAGLVVLRTPDIVVDGRDTLYSAPCSFVLSDEEWRDEQVFSGARYSFMSVDTAFPALVNHHVTDIQTLYLAWTENLNASEPEHVYQIDTDKGLLPEPPPPYSGPPIPTLPAGQAWQIVFTSGQHYIFNSGSVSVRLWLWNGTEWITNPGWIAYPPGTNFGKYIEDTGNNRLVDVSPDGVASFGDYIYTNAIRNDDGTAWSGGLLPASGHAVDNHGNPGDPLLSGTPKYPNVYV